MTQNKDVRRGRLKLLFIALVFFGPLAAAWVLYFNLPGASPGQRGNHGQLLDPAQPLPALQLRTPAGDAIAGREVFDEVWTLLYLGPSNCAETCRARLYDTRQVRAALHRRASRLQRVFAVTDTESLGALQKFAAERHPDLRILLSKNGRLERFLNGQVKDAGANGHVYLFDPLGNWVLYYRPEDAAKGMLEDLKRLMRLSRIG